MKKHVRLLEPLRGYASRDAASFLAQLDDQTRRLREDTRGLSDDALAWQPERGMNTIGMLLAHMAIVEVHWIGVLSQKPAEFERVIGIGVDDDGMPLAPQGVPPAGLAGKPLAYFDELLARARRHVKQRVKPLTGAALNGKVERISRIGEKWTMTRRWILYHLLEHFAGHYGQILLLKHQYAAVTGTERVPA